ncbi:hypothetical protein CK489_21030 [Bradyrhizobium sp. UFLA03-84]|uniref:hypothetical protein n=1 Tax=Bradyrhizobium sp. UFLA03-84 TaxID=418599 RepID=UPI000BAE5A93|nr:hypothetical protein [Bradyrhizobium sp. UFLA03-84]PAY08139.1 hypothetical protein CK489_21030 [Bradyrhizobium sp. UFLA03-84]
MAAIRGHIQRMSIIKPTGLRPGWRKFMIAVYVAVTTTLAYGVWMYPDAPLHRCSAEADTYCGKRGKVHTLSEYEGFRRWENALFIVGPIGLGLQILGGLLGRQKK